MCNEKRRKDFIYVFLDKIKLFGKNHCARQPNRWEDQISEFTRIQLLTLERIVSDRKIEIKL